MLKANSHKKDSMQSGTDALFAKASEQWDRGKLRSAFRLFLSAAKAGDSGAQVNLGHFYDNGLGVKPNREAALFWYRRAYRRGERCAASNIGVLRREEGKLDQALAWFHRAVKLRDGDANLEIAKIYLREKGEAERAIPYLKRAAKAKPSDVTEGSKQEAHRLLIQIVRKKSPKKTGTDGNRKPEE